MQCPSCKAVSKDKVVDSRTTEGGAVIRRRRECLECGRRFTTKERVEEELRLAVVKRDGSRVPYDRQKLVHGVSHACYKLSISDEQIDRLIDNVEGDIFQKYEREVTSDQIGEHLIARLRELNAVAYVRFMSVYRNYSDIEEFVEEVRKVTDLSALEIPEQRSLFER